MTRGAALASVALAIALLAPAPVAARCGPAPSSSRSDGPAAPGLQGTQARKGPSGEATIDLRGKPQRLRFYGPRTGIPVVLSSGDGGWIHLAPHAAEVLAARGFFVVGFDSRAYLSSFTGKEGGLSAADVQGDYGALAAYAARETGCPPVLVGVSEGAGLSVLAASGGTAKERVRGVVGLGLPEWNELGWHWRDVLIYLTHAVPHEPLFSASAVVAGVAPLPLALIHSTRDEFAPRGALDRILARAEEPKRLWMVNASDHGFTDNRPAFDRALVEAMAWIALSRYTSPHVNLLRFPGGRTLPASHP